MLIISDYIIHYTLQVCCRCCLILLEVTLEVTLLTSIEVSQSHLGSVQCERERYYGSAVQWRQEERFCDLA